MKRALCLCLILFAARSGSADEPITVDAMLSAVDQQMRAERWGKARQAIALFLEEHGEGAAIVERRDAIVTAMKEATYRLKYGATDTKKVVSGRLTRWDRETGDLSIDYAPRTLSDWKPLTSSRTIPRRPLVHPARFLGPYRIEIRGSAFMKADHDTWHDLKLDVAGDRDFFIAFGEVRRPIRIGQRPYPRAPAKPHLRMGPARITYRQDGSDFTFAEVAANPIRPGEKYHLRVDVTAKSILVRSFGKRMMGCVRKIAIDDTVSFAPFRFDKLTLSGKVDPGWIDTLVEKAEAPTRLKFEKTWRPKRHLPAWLFDD